MYCTNPKNRVLVYWTLSFPDDYINLEFKRINYEVYNNKCIEIQFFHTI